MAHVLSDHRYQQPSLRGEVVTMCFALQQLTCSNLKTRYKHQRRHARTRCTGGIARCSWCLSVLIEIHLPPFVSSNELYEHWRSFAESFSKSSFFIFNSHMAFNMARNREMHAKWCFWWSLSCLSVLIERVLLTVVGSNRLYACRRRFPESLRNITFFIFTLQMASTWVKTRKFVQNAVSGDVRRVYLVR